ncbi:transposase [Nostoc sp. PCC 7524]|uniref:REP-associated tyrosine transposase n=1 Tax=Nostoc sp. (strain ATCC 29411 / PCC 7524) TaxID=28072 RepID=UPI00029F0D0C|nr:transposase [Nostoc sp. PCC 7524]AFY47327.1 transposase [Nostoc sp. PCC 7524]
MPIRDVKFQAGNYYHIYNRGNNRQAIFFERQNYLFFLRLMERHLVNKGVEIVAYCLMPNHYHLLVYLNTDNLSNLMQPFMLAYTKAINKRFKRVGSLFQGRFQSIHIDSNEYLLHLSRYIHLNPVNANLVKNPQEWEFSSYSEYIMPHNHEIIKIDKVLQHFVSLDSYRLFVESPRETGFLMET